MADFAPAFEEVLASEGGWQETNNPKDRGGRTFAGVAFNRNPQWEGWRLIDRRAPRDEIQDSVRRFFRENYWDALKLDGVENQTVATSIYSTGVLQGVGLAARLAQMAVEVPVDGHIGPITLGAINEIPKPEYFLAMLMRAKTARFVAIGWKDREQREEFFFGWIARAVRESEA